MAEKLSSHSSPSIHLVMLPHGYMPTDEEIELERQRREEADRKRDAATPRNVLPSTLDTLRAECEAHRHRIVEAMRQGQRFYPFTNANYAARLKGDAHGHLLPSLEPLWHAAAALDLNGTPSFPGEPQTALEAVAALDSLLAAIGGTAPAPTDSSVKKKPKRRGGRPRLEHSNRLKAQLYERIRKEREQHPGEPQTELAARLRADKDLVEMGRRGGVERITPKVIRAATAHMSQRQRDVRKKQETDPV
ncbi:MAG TPA: hypothetical protein VH643_03425 [Gemmataceae bacterium]|jgi:hypothetical protein